MGNTSEADSIAHRRSKEIVPSWCIVVELWWQSKRHAMGELKGSEEVAEGKELISSMVCGDGIVFKAAAVVSDVSDSRSKGDPYHNRVSREYSLSG